jgi:hypothetical protein
VDFWRREAYICVLIAFLEVDKEKVDEEESTREGMVSFISRATNR